MLSGAPGGKARDATTARRTSDAPPRERRTRRRASGLRGAGQMHEMTESTRILCYGDSLTAGYTAASPYTGEYAPWAPHLAIALGVSVEHVGMSGWTTRQMLDHQNSRVGTDVCGEKHPGLGHLCLGGRFCTVILMAGTNDLGERPAEEIFANLKALHEICHASGAQTVALSIPQSKAAMAGPAFLGQRREHVNSLLSAYARDNAKCVYLPMDLEIPWSEGSPNWEADGLHMTKCGYEELARRLAPRLRVSTVHEIK